MTTINNGESGLSVRTKLNEVINKIEGVTSIGNNIGVTGTITATRLQTVNTAIGTDTDVQLFADANNTAVRSKTSGGGVYIQSNDGVKTHARFDTPTGDISFYEDTGTTPKFFWDASAEALGIGTSSPATLMHVSASYSAPTGGYDGAVAAVVSNSGSADNYVGLALSGGSNGGSFVHFGDADDADAGAVAYFHNGNYMRFDVNASERMRIDSSGNVLIGGTAAGTASAGNLVLVNGTAPTGNVTNGITLYAEDVSASSELKVRDEAGNVTTLSPHNFDLIPEGPSEDMAWSYYSERDGKRINVDMLKAIRLLEQITGEKLVHMA